MKNKWIVLSLLTGLIVLAGVIVMDLYRGSTSVNHTGANDIHLPAEAAPQPAETETNETTNEEGPDTAKAVSFQPEEAELVIFGDLLLHENVLNNANRLAGGTGGREGYAAGFDFKPIFENVSSWIKGADFSLATQASLAGGNDAPSALSGYPKFNGPSSIAQDLWEIGFDGMNLATNHALDLGTEGWNNAVRTWREKNLLAVGAYKNAAEAHEAENKIVLVNGVRIAFLSYVSDTNYKLIGSTETSIPYFTVNGTAIRKKMVRDDIEACREIADAVIVFVYWSGDASFEETEFQREAAQFLADAGADVVIGNGPKVLQKTEWIARSDGKQTLCAYSLGNSVCTMQYIENLLGGVLRFTIMKTEKGVSIRNVTVEPTIVWYDENVDHLKILPLSQLDEERFERHGSNVLFGKGRYEWLAETVKKQIPETFLPGEYR